MELDWLRVSWQLLVVRGVIATVFGIVAMAWPVETITVLVVLWGIWALVDGVTWLAQSVSVAQGTARLLFAGMGALALIVSAIAVFRPQVAATAVTWVLGAWLLVRAVTELVLAFTKAPPAPRALLVLSALVDGAIGIVFVANPGKAAVGVAWLLGLLAIVWGLVFIALGIAARHALNETASSEPATPGRLAM